MENKIYKISPFIILNALFKDFRSFIFLIIAIIKEGDDKFFWGLTLLSFGINLISSCGKYLKSSLVFEKDVLVYNTGVSIQQTKYLKINDIQNIDTTAKLLYRLFGLVELDINVIDDSIKIGPIKKSSANEIINNINILKNSSFDITENNDYLMKYGFKDLFLLSLVKSKLIITIFVILGASKEIIDMIELIFDIDFNKLLTDTNINIFENVKLLILFILSILTLVFVISLLTTLIKFYDFTLENKKDQLVCKYGLFNKKSIIVRKNNIQKVSIATSWRAELLGLKSLTISTTTNNINEDLALNNEVEIIPIGKIKFIDEFVNNILQIDSAYFENNGTILTRDTEANNFIKRRFFIKTILTFIILNIASTLLINYVDINKWLILSASNAISIVICIIFYLSYKYNVKYTKINLEKNMIVFNHTTFMTKNIEYIKPKKIANIIYSSSIWLKKYNISNISLKSYKDSSSLILDYFPNKYRQTIEEFFLINKGASNE